MTQPTSANVGTNSRPGSPLTPRTKIPKPNPGETFGKNFANPDPGTALSIVYRPLAELQRYARNPRTHSDAQIAKLRASLQRFGWTNPILIADGQIIAGHGRQRAAADLYRAGVTIKLTPDPALAPTVDLSHLSEPERRAYVIADNRLAEDAGWDKDLLRMEFADLKLAGLDLTITGFELPELSKLLTPEDTAPQDRALSAAEDDAMDHAWKRAIGEWKAILDTAPQRDWLTPSFTKGSLAVLYLRSLYFNDEIPRAATYAYTPHRLTTIGDKGAIVDALSAALAEDGRSVRASIRWVSGEKPSLDKLIGTTSLAIHGMRVPADFPALLARDLIDEFAPPASAILDPCHGWGGRCLGFLLSQRARRYTGYDPAPDTHTGVKAMFADLAALTPERDKSAQFLCAPFEQSVLKPASFDFALTSPPYFDIERYDGADSSFRRYPDFDAWIAGFFSPLIALTSRALKPNAVFALQVGSQSYPLKERAISLCDAHGFIHEATRHTTMVNNRTGTEKDDGEVIVILRRRS